MDKVWSTVGPLPNRKIILGVGLVIQNQKKQILVVMDQDGVPAKERKTSGQISIPLGKIKISQWEEIFNAGIREGKEETGLTLEREKMHLAWNLVLTTTNFLIYVNILKYMDYIPSEKLFEINTRDYFWEEIAYRWRMSLGQLLERETSTVRSPLYEALLLALSSEYKNILSDIDSCIENPVVIENGIYIEDPKHTKDMLWKILSSK